MEQTNQDTSLFDLKIDETSKDLLRKIATWAMVVVVTSLIGYVAQIIQVAIAKNQTVEYEGFKFSERSKSNIGSTVFSIVVGLLLTYFLYQFASLSKKGVDAVSQPDLNKSFANLKYYFMVTGILIIIGFTIGLLVMLVFGTANMSR
jgi:hypothetical protein